MIKERARNKAFSKIKTKKLEIKKLKHDIKRGNTGVVTLDHLQLCLKVAEKELTTWNYIFKLIELDYEKTKTFSDC